IEILGLFIAAHADLKILILRRSLDPCVFPLSIGIEAFAAAMLNAMDAFSYKLRVVINGLDIADEPHLAHDALDDILGTLARAPRLSVGVSSDVRLREHQVLARLGRQFRVDEDSLRKRIGDLRSNARRPRTMDPAHAERPTPRFTLADLNFWDRELLE